MIKLEKSHMLTQSVWHSEQIRTLEYQAAKQAGVSMMELMARAGLAVFHQAHASWPHAQHWWVMTGSGNNGGDGYIVARLAHAAGIKVTLVQVGDETRQSDEAAQARHAYLEAGGTISELSALQSDKEPDLIIDALLGIGFKGVLRPAYAQAISLINHAHTQLKTPVLAIDIPSGLESNTGHIATVAVQANITVCMIGLKLGLLTGRGPDVAGRVLLASLNIESALSHHAQFLTSAAQVMHWSALRPLLPSRRVAAHKGEAGRVLAVGGNLGMSGAIRLAGEGALRCGAGLVRLLSHKEHQFSLNLGRPELMTARFPDFNDWQWPSCMVLGPGLGRDDWAFALYQCALQHNTAPMVIDADALWWLAQNPRLAHATSAIKQEWVLTPHSGEAARLLQCTVAEIEADRLRAVRTLQSKYGGVVVLKGAGTLVADEQQVRVCHYGNNGMASGGMGDLLSGIIAALLAQGLSTFTAASLGVCLHAIAADRAAREGKRGLLASDLLLPLRCLLNEDEEYDE
ncbi:NAD(P)H-hydrate dehydratase [Oceanisphaera avium]|nr:NAD(P)H-hydrate dehydratase [Oceanisphaera avium]